MERIQLSKDIIFQKVFTILLFAVIITVMISNTVNIPYVIGTLVIAIFLGYRTIYLADNIEFDNKNMFVRTRNDEVAIDLADVYAIKLTLAHLNRQRMWKIKYRINGVDKAARCYPNYSPGLEEFIRNVKSRNPDVKVRNTVGPFDFDV
ncbi:MAG: hypothetical protein JST19_23010 [Bacteroidetes bacterium]|nr:hypothetical protein [Bacteroidota bacterium]